MFIPLWCLLKSFVNYRKVAENFSRRGYAGSVNIFWYGFLLLLLTLGLQEFQSIKDQRCNWNSTTFCTIQTKQGYAMASPSRSRRNVREGEVKIYTTSHEGDRRHLCVTKESDNFPPNERYVVKACSENTNQIVVADTFSLRRVQPINGLWALFVQIDEIYGIAHKKKTLVLTICDRNNPYYCVTNPADVAETQHFKLQHDTSSTGPRNEKIRMLVGTNSTYCVKAKDNGSIETRKIKKFFYRYQQERCENKGCIRRRACNCETLPKININRSTSFLTSKQIVERLMLHLEEIGIKVPKKNKVLKRYYSYCTLFSFDSRNNPA